MILEEPEHLFYFQPWSGLKRKRRHVTGIVHTNYKKYTEAHPDFNRRMFYKYNRGLMQWVCHHLICTSSVHQDVCRLPHCAVENVNGVNPLFSGRSTLNHSRGIILLGNLFPKKGWRSYLKDYRPLGCQRLIFLVRATGRGSKHWRPITVLPRSSKGSANSPA